MMMGSQKVEQVEVIPTGSLMLNHALGVGGYPKGRIIEIYGPESSGKTTLAIHAIAEAQKAGGIAAIIDAEHAFDRFYAEKLGVDLENLLISQPDNGEQALEIADQLIRSAAIDIVVIDSVAALTPKAEIEGDMGDNKVGLQARLMSQALRKVTSTISKTNTTCIFINQLREKIGVMFGNPETTTGGNALKFYSSVRLDIRRVTSSRTETRWLETRFVSRWSRIRWRLLSVRLSLKSCSEKVSARWERFSTSVSSITLSRRAEAGSAITIASWPRDATAQSRFCVTTPNCATR
jgi:protein RecA